MLILKIIALSTGSIVVLFILTKIMGQREMSQLSIFDYIISITIGSIAAEMATSLEDNFVEPLVAMIVYAVVTLIIGVLNTRFVKLRPIFSGRTLILYDNGTLFKENFKKSKIDLNEFLVQCRTSGYFNLSDLKNKFMFDNKYGIITPYYKDGIGEVFIKQLVKNEYYLNEVAEKIRLFYVALTRAKEKIIMVMPEVDDKTKSCEEVDFLEGLSFRSFYNFLESIYGNIAKYVTSINLNNIGLSKEYEFSKAISRNLESSKEEMVIYAF